VRLPLAIGLACGAVLLGPAAGGAQAHTFTPNIDNPYLPWKVGSRWAYHDVLTGERTVVKVTGQTKRIANGVTARVVHDTVRKHGHVTEDTFDWYAQDERGNVWYMGEDTKEFAHGKVSSTEGSWEAGVDGARAGIAMPRHPRVGRQYRQEYYAGQAEDMARVLSLDDQVEVPAGHYKRAILTREWTPLEPDVLEYKLYARGVGIVMESTVSGGAERNELVRFTR
jgi:hypothetical protein